MILQNIITNSHNIKLINKNFLIQRIDNISSESYFNLFSIDLWKSCIGAQFIPYCHLEFEGIGYCNIVGIKYDGTKKVLKYYVRNNSINAILSSIFLYYYVEWNEDLNLKKGYYGAKNHKFDTHDISICIITVTFDRNKEIKDLIKSFSESLQYNELSKIIELLIVNNNPCTINDEISDYINKLKIKNKVKIITSCNSGGSGGFIKGIEYCKAHSKHSHVILCDDDIILHPETIFRTYRLLECQTQKADTIISGSMFELENQNHCHCIYEGLTRRGHHQLHFGNIDIPSNSNVLANIIMSMVLRNESVNNDRDYAAWWYCCIPMTLINKNRPPFQFFIRGDDQEYGIRLKTKIIALNGIQVWHPAFNSKRTEFRFYLGNRNYTVINFLHFNNYKTNILLHYTIKIWQALQKGNKREILILSKSLEDAVKFDNKEYTFRYLTDSLKKHQVSLSNSLLKIVKYLLIIVVRGNRIKAGILKALKD